MSSDPVSRHMRNAAGVVMALLSIGAFLLRDSYAAVLLLCLALAALSSFIGPSVDGFPGSFAVRRGVHMGVLLLPALLGYTTGSWTVGASALAGVALGVVFVTPEVLRGRALWRRGVLAFFPDVRLPEFASETSALLMAPILEELFTKGFVVGALTVTIGAPAAVVCGALVFVGLHVIAVAPREHVSAFQIASWATFSLLNGALFVATGSLTACIIAHLTANMPSIILWCRRFAYTLSHTHVVGHVIDPAVERQHAKEGGVANA